MVSRVDVFLERTGELDHYHLASVARPDDNVRAFGGRVNFSGENNRRGGKISKNAPVRCSIEEAGPSLFLGRT